MKKIVVIGCPGAGKSTFARKLSDTLKLPLFHLDAIWHKADRTHISREEFDQLLGGILEKDAWIIDGHYSRTLERRIVASDTVFFFDLPVEACLEGALSRVGQTRKDMPWVDDALDPNLKREIEGFAIQNRPVVYELLEKYRSGKTVVILKSRAEADAYLRQLSSDEK